MFCSIKLKAEKLCSVCSQLLRLAGMSSPSRRRAVDTASLWPVNSAVVPMRSLSEGWGGGVGKRTILGLSESRSPSTQTRLYFRDAEGRGGTRSVTSSNEAQRTAAEANRIIEAECRGHETLTQ